MHKNYFKKILYLKNVIMISMKNATSKFDIHPELIGFTNGVYDLQNNEFRETSK